MAARMRPAGRASLFLQSWSCRGGHNTLPEVRQLRRVLIEMMKMLTWCLSIVMLTVRKMLVASMM